MADLNVEKKHDGREQNESQGILKREDQASQWRTPADLFATNPFSLMRRFSDEMDRAFFGRGSGAGRSAIWYPDVDVTERDGKLQVRADLPGIDPDDVKVEVTGDSITIQGERKQEHEEKGRGFHRVERSYGQFYRSIPLPEGAKTEEARARFDRGVLEVAVPIPERQQNRRQIPIEAGGTERREPASETGWQRRESKAS